MKILVIFLDFLIKKWLLIECILHFHFVSKFPNFLPTLAIHQVKMLKLSLPITYYRAPALLKLFIGNSQISIHGRRRGGGSGEVPLSPTAILNIPDIFMPFPPSLQKILGSLTYSPSLEKIFSLSYSPLCRKSFTSYSIPPSP